MTPTAGSLFMVIGSLALLAFLSWATYQSGKILRDNPPDFNLLLAPGENVARAVIIVLCLGIGLGSGMDPVRLGWTVTDPLGALTGGVALGLAVQLPLSWLTRIAVDRLGKDIYSPVVVRLVLPRDRREAMLTVAAFLPAVLMEELLFRSLLVGGFSVFINPWILALVWSMAFGAMHLPQGSWGMMATSVIGFVLGGAFIMTGGLLAPIVAHYAINVLQVWDADRHRRWLEEY